MDNREQIPAMMMGKRLSPNARRDQLLNTAKEYHLERKPTELLTAMASASSIAAAGYSHEYSMNPVQAGETAEITASGKRENK